MRLAFGVFVLFCVCTASEAGEDGLCTASDATCQSGRPAVVNQAMIFAKRPEGEPDHSTFRLELCPMPKLDAGEILVRVTFVSVDPYMRGQMRQDWVPGQPGRGHLTGIVLRSKSERFSEGDTVAGFAPWQLFVKGNASSFLPISVSAEVPASAYLGVLGMPGLSAYFPTLEIGQPKAGETVFVSGAAGVVGLAAGQLAKARGARVVGSAGSDAKVAFLKEAGFDEAFNYRTTATTEALDRFCPGGIDVYWDNVGGETLDAALARMKTFGRIVACGMISQYNAQGLDEVHGLKNYVNIVGKQLLFQGFIVNRWASRFGEGYAALSEGVRSGNLTIKETILEGFAKIPDAFAGLFKGDNIGKMSVKVEEL